MVIDDPIAEVSRTMTVAARGDPRTATATAAVKATRPRPRPSLRAPGRPSSDRSAGPGRRRRGRRRRPGSARSRWAGQ